MLGLGAGGHAGGQDLVRVTVEVLAGSLCIVVRGSACQAAICTSHRSTLASKLMHGSDKGVPQHAGMRPGDLDAGGPGEVARAAGDRVPVHPGAAGVQQDRPAGPGSCCAFKSAADRWR
jgi:hypothetical protein